MPSSPPLSGLGGKKVLLCITGGIAAYKAPDLVRRLREAGAEVEVAMTESAREFVAPLALQAVAGRPIHCHLLPGGREPGEEGVAASHADAMEHISLARWADLLLVAPATANVMSRLVQGAADDLVCALCLACEAKRMLAPAMNASMWQDSATQRNLQQLRDDGWLVAGPDEGEQACGETGPGRMLEPTALVQSVCAAFQTGELAGYRVVITAGPTREMMDPVRYISNRSSGRMGFAIAEAAAEAGASVRLIAGPVSLPTPPAVERVDVLTAEQMHAAAMQAAEGADLFIGTAAVCDYRPADYSADKLKREKLGDKMDISLVRNPDIVSSVAALSPRPFILAFAAETRDLQRNAADKLRRKQVDMVAANDVSIDGQGFDADNNELLLLSAKGGEPVHLPNSSKQKLARQLISRLAEAVPAAKSAAEKSSRG